MTAPLRAPAEDGAVLAVPPLGGVGELIEANRRLGRGPLGDLRDRARRELLQRVTHYLAGRGEPVGDFSPGKPLLLAGHQPELFHPGVWAKNFALAGLARRHNAVAVNLLVDNDSVKSTALRVPARTPSGPVLRAIAFDRWLGEVPWEERRVLDPQAFARFGDEVCAVMRDWGVEPLVGPLWPRVRALLGDGPLGDALAAARRELERAWGCANAEVPLGLLCQGEAFARFAGLLLAELPRFAAVHNAAVRAYRRHHGLRSKSHPVPELAADGDWLEAPLWAWRAGEGRRGRLFVRARPDRVELRAGAEPWPALPPPHSEAFAPAWRDLHTAGHKVRSRALTTTLFARLCLADVFIHGIGGAKYDELTDELIRQFFGQPPPAFLTVSATRLLPLPAPAVTSDDRRRLARQLRDLRYNPQRHLDGALDAAAEAAVRRKQELIATAPDEPGPRRERFRRLREVNEALAPLVRGREEAARRDLAAVEGRLRDRALLRRRDYSFCLYPEEALRPFLARLL